jgi:oxazoline/thiazoline dehydrogenase
VLSRFAYLRNRDGEAVLESPLSQARIAIYDEECFNTIFRLMRPHTCQQLFVDRRALSQHEMQAFIELLYALSIVREAGDEDAGESRNWEFHDMVFHTRTRLWRHESPIGATFRFGLKSPRVPALKPHMATECVKLFRPDIESLTRKDMPFTEVLEGRRSLRDDSGRVICLDRLGEFLYRAARVRSSTRYANAENELVVTDRPYPNAGACYELEIYILIERCEGISPGLYHYRPDSHELCGVCADKSCLEQMVQDARVATHGTVPQVMLIVAARFARVFWKYEGIAYSLILKNVGVLLQTMYLVATAMGLRPCAIGAGNSRLFSAATRINGLAESSVGEFILNE